MIIVFYDKTKKNIIAYNVHTKTRLIPTSYFLGLNCEQNVACSPASYPYLFIFVRAKSICFILFVIFAI